MKKRSTGFTLIELMIVVSIVGILSSIAIPKFADMIRKSKQGNSKGSLGSMRSALSIYYADVGGFFPMAPKGTNSTVLADALVPRYLNLIPKIQGLNVSHNDTNSVYAHNTSMGHAHDTGTWMYDGNDTGDIDWGKLWIDCSHVDSTGRQWTSY